jgi:hypothetical protein
VRLLESDQLDIRVLAFVNLVFIVHHRRAGILPPRALPPAAPIAHSHPKLEGAAGQAGDRLSLSAFTGRALQAAGQSGSRRASRQPRRAPAGEVVQLTTQESPSARLRGRSDSSFTSSLSCS